MATNEIKFLDRNAPTQALEEAREVAARLYGIDGEFRSLHSERDQNFGIDATDGGQFVLKIANRDESTDIVDFQIGALRHIAEQDASLPVPRVIPDKEGHWFSEIRFANDDKHIVYLLSFLQGTLLSDSRCGGSPAVLRRLGAFVAAIDIALRGYFHPAAAQQHPWNIETCTRLRHLSKHIESNEDRAAIDEVFEHMSEVVIPRLKSLRHQVVHQDAHADNVLVNPDNPAEITGLIDFGDLLHGTLVAEIAVACDSVPHGFEDLPGAISDIVAGYDAVLPLDEDEIELIYDLVAARNALTAVIVAARAAITPEQPTHIASTKPYSERLRQLREIGRLEFTRLLRTVCRFPAYCPKSADEALSSEEEDGLIAARRSLLGRNTTHFYARPMHFERARGPWLYSTDGHRYLDCYNNVPQVGHCHPHVVRAIARQSAALNTNTRYLYSSALEYAERLTAKLAPHLSACVFVNSGSEANDVAWQMAKLVTGRHGAVIMEDAYHGVTDVIRQFSPGHPDTELPDFLRGLVVPDPYRGPFREGDADLVNKYAMDADRAIGELATSGHGTAAFMIDSAMCSSGVPDTPVGYLRAVEEKIRAAGGLMICDEVQSGFGRMGQWWGHEHHGVKADIVTMGKPVGNGHPLGVVVTTEEILNRFIDKTRLFSTFGGNTVACAAGNAVLDVIEQEGLIESGNTVGRYLRDELAKLAAKHELIGDIRGHGMVSGLEFVTNRQSRTPATEETARLLELMRRQHVLVGSEGRDANVLKLRPSLVFQKTHVDVFIDALDCSLDAL